MQITMTRPVTLLEERHAQRWFPFFFKHTDGSILLYLQHSYDAHFAPAFRLRSIDGGRTWLEEEEHVPRLTWAWSFADSQLIEVDTYGVQNPHRPEMFGYYGALSLPGSPSQNVERFMITIEAPSAQPIPISDFQNGTAYPTFPWWPLINELHEKPEVDTSEIFVGGPYLTSGVADGERLLATGYALHRVNTAGKTSVFFYESSDHGRTWREVTLIANGETGDTPEGFNESSLVRLKSGDLYVVMRGGDQLFHSRSHNNGSTWTAAEPLRLVDSDFIPRRVWPICRVLFNGSLVLTFGRPGKHIIFDPTGTGTRWQDRIDLHQWELETQELMGVPPELRLRGDTDQCIRYWDSSDYLACIEIEPDVLLIAYDVQNYHEHWNSTPVSGVRLVRMRLSQ